MDIAGTRAGVPSHLEDRRLWTGLTVFALASLIGNEIGSALRYPDIGAAVFFPPYAVLTAALVASPRRQWIWFIIVASLTHFITHWPQWSWSWVLLADVANVARALVAAVLLQRVFAGRPVFDNLHGLSAFFLAAVIVAPAVGASIGAANVVLHGASATYWTPWRAWFVSNALTALTMLPACLSAFAAVRAGIQLPRLRRRIGETLLLLTTLVATCALAFVGGLGRQHLALPLYGSLPVLIWAAIRFGVSGTSVSLTAIAFAAVWSVDRGTGPFLAASPDDNILALQLFIACTSAPVLLLATLASGRTGALQLYRALLASLEDHVAILDADGVVIAVNESWRRAATARDAPILHRAQAGDEYLRVCESASAAGDVFGAELAAGLAGVLAGTRPRFEIECDRTSGSLTETFAITVEKLERTEGGAVIIRRNVTASRQADRELHAQRDQLSHLARVTTVSHLSGALAHELHQPLAAIQTNVEVVRRLLRAGAKDADVLDEILNDVVADNRRAVGIIDSLRGLLKKRDVRFEAIDVRDLIDEVLTLAGTELVARKVAVSTEIAAELPRLHGDRVQLQQLLLNLLLNGADAMASSSESKPGSRRLVIAAADSGNGIIHLRVRDNGPGIPTALLPRLFTPFTTTKVHGLGLGLSICHSIVSGHGGQLWAENNADGGATLHCRLPAGEWFSAEALPSSPSRQISVAIVDDDASIRTSLMRVCTMSGMMATAYASGAEVLTALSQGLAPDCLLVDVHMPEMSGPDLHRELIARGFDIPTVAISADTSLAMHTTARIAGSVMFLSKPISADTLLTTIRRVANPRLTRSRGQRAEL